MTLFASLAPDYLRLKRLAPTDDPPGRMIALAGDAELDEGNIFEALLEGWKHDVRNLWWVINSNRQSLDAARTANRSISACRRGRSISPGGRSTRISPRRSSPAPTGCASRGPAPNSR
jgi:hypothetical protein